MPNDAPKKIGELLLAKGYITDEQLRTGLSIQSQSSRKLGNILVEAGIITEEQLVEIISEKLIVPRINLASLVINPEIVQLIPVDLAKKHTIFPIFKMGQCLTVVMADPLNVNALDEVRYVTKCIIKRAVAGEKSIREAIDSYYSVADSVRDILGDELNEDTISENILAEDNDAIVSGEGTVVRLVNLIITRAIADGASDIHIEPDENQLRIRYRVNGIMREEADPPKKLQAEIISRIKIASDLDVSEKRLPQDGRMGFVYKSRNIDLRISTLPTIHGEKIVIRILDRDKLKTGFTDLGLTGSVLENWRHHIRKPEGLILITGPTSSGKTSTLYSSLQEVNSIEKNIITVEDPVEYSLPLINQVQINEKAGLLFASALRSILRQNPDTIMVGEIRDRETAAIAVRAALTGHLVFSTIHTNDSMSTISRLIDMGIERYLVTSALEAILAQRLVRTICQDCKRPTEVPDSIMDRAFPNGPPDKLKLFRGVGCRLCRNTGYGGLTGIFELVGITDKLREMILAGKSEAELKAEAYLHGYRPLFESGLELVSKGLTTLDEVLKVTLATDTIGSILDRRINQSV